MQQTVLLNDDGSLYEPQHDLVRESLPIEPPGLLLVGLKDTRSSVPLHKVSEVLGEYMNRFPGLIQAQPDISVGLCIWDSSVGKWVALTREMLSK